MKNIGINHPKSLSHPVETEEARASAFQHCMRFVEANVTREALGFSMVSEYVVAPGQSRELHIVFFSLG